MYIQAADVPQCAFYRGGTCCLGHKPFAPADLKGPDHIALLIVKRDLPVECYILIGIWNSGGGSSAKRLLVWNMAEIRMH